MKLTIYKYELEDLLKRIGDKLKIDIELWVNIYNDSALIEDEKRVK